MCGLMPPTYPNTVQLLTALVPLIGCDMEYIGVEGVCVLERHFCVCTQMVVPCCVWSLCIWRAVSPQSLSRPSAMYVWCVESGFLLSSLTGLMQRCSKWWPSGSPFHISDYFLLSTCFPLVLVQT